MEIRSAISALAANGYRFLLSQNATEENISELAQAYLAGSGGQDVQDEDASLQENLQVLLSCKEPEGGFFACAFGEEDSTQDMKLSPRNRRLMLQVSLLNLMHQSDLASKVYIRILCFPGAWSYQMYEASMLRTALKAELSNSLVKRLSTLWLVPNMRGIDKDIRQKYMEVLTQGGARKADDKVRVETLDSFIKFMFETRFWIISSESLFQTMMILWHCCFHCVTCYKTQNLAMKLSGRLNC